MAELSAGQRQRNRVFTTNGHWPVELLIAPWPPWTASATAVWSMTVRNHIIGQQLQVSSPLAIYTTTFARPSAAGSLELSPEIGNLHHFSIIQCRVLCIVSFRSRNTHAPCLVTYIHLFIYLTINRIRKATRVPHQLDAVVVCKRMAQSSIAHVLLFYEWVSTETERINEWMDDLILQATGRWWGIWYVYVLSPR